MKRGDSQHSLNSISSQDSREHKIPPTSKLRGMEGMGWDRGFTLKKIIPFQ